MLTDAVLDETQAPLVPASFEVALKAIAAARLPYVALNRTATPETEGAEAFARATAAAIFADRAVWDAETVVRFFGWAVERPAANTFALVLAALNALDAGEGERAGVLARRAAGQLTNDLFIQTLERRAAGREVDEGALAERFCPVPFQTIETAPGGDVFTCCPAWLPVPIGNLESGTPEQIWNSETAQAIRRSIHDGSFRYCSRKHCAHLSSGTLPRRDAVKGPELREIMAERRTRLDHRPRKLVLAHDRSCTLSCPSCRTEVIVAKGVELARLDRMAETVLLPLARDARVVRVTSSGDAFGSKHFRRVMRDLNRRDYPGLALEIQTNGVLFDAAAWTELDLAGRLALVAVSLDAAEAGTYAVVRRGGDHARLLGNLAFLGARRRAGEIAQLRIDFVVQALNFRQMPAMPAIAARYGVDAVKFQMIRNWNTWTPAEFAAQDIGARAHPEYPAFLATLCHPALAAPEISFWGMGAALAEAERAA